MKILIDAAIPYLEEYLPQINWVKLPGREISAQHVQHVDGLIIRSITTVDERLIQHTPLRFVATASSGIDHIDQQYLHARNIPLISAEGSNSQAVIEYVMCVLAALQTDKVLTNKPRIGVIGAGRIGMGIVNFLKEKNYPVLVYDPLLKTPGFVSDSLSEFTALDCITIHTPLTTTGPYPTHHLINNEFLSALRPGTVIINTARGSVVNMQDLKKYASHLRWCFDVWENEPQIDQTILSQSVIATPHIAGHTLQSKQRASEMIAQKLIGLQLLSSQQMANIKYPEITLPNSNAMTWQDRALEIWDPRLCTATIKNNFIPANATQSFDTLRKEMGNRCEFAFVNRH